MEIKWRRRILDWHPRISGDSSRIIRNSTGLIYILKDEHERSCRSEAVSSRLVHFWFVIKGFVDTHTHIHTLYLSCPHFLQLSSRLCSQQRLNQLPYPRLDEAFEESISTGDCTFRPRYAQRSPTLRPRNHQTVSDLPNTNSNHHIATLLLVCSCSMFGDAEAPHAAVPPANCATLCVPTD